ncbi:putative Cystathionine gamma-synthase [Glarea lozoyensis 74030]|uniref:Putative Cystathionine gamma-synthase n=1 Tax=Glarea lozoyensis (strain ATCC 74030 / MF5533) TaxID=1104152 RepID=H0EH69_GLAL7|nr:putative Cystathionine gamma-synthase [Glarea lozoyensis 74030]
MAIAFGEPIPIGDEHDSEVLEALKSGYPRFSLHKAVSRLEERLLSWATSLPCHTLALVPEEAIKLFPSDRMAKACQKYLQASEVENRGKMRVRVAHITLDGELEDISGVQAATWHDPPEEHVFSAIGLRYLVLSNILGFNSTHYGYGSSKDMDALEYELKEGRAIDALYTEFPTNPLLTIVDLERLHALSVQYDFVLVVDDTIGTPINLLIAPWCDVVCTSLTKMYSGAGNVMGGSAVVSPWSRHHGVLRAALTAYHEDTYFPHDLLVMHANSSKFEERVATASRNAQSVAELLRRHRLVTEVLYPWGGPTQSLYDKFKRPVSVRFSQPAVAIAFHDALETAKGPSFGTNFTLACPYTVLAHYGELDWAAQFGVWEHLVRISVGAEDLESS